MTTKLEFAKVENTLTSLMTVSGGAAGLSNYPTRIGTPLAYADGTGDMQGRKVIEKYANLSNTNIDINLTSELDKSGVAAALTRLSAFAVTYNAGTAGTYLTVKMHATAGVTGIFLAVGDGIKLAVGETHIFAFVNERTVTATTADILCNLVSTVTDAYYTVVAIGS